ncbi:MAG: site-specific DNA-methyltransferase [Nitrospirae bacterium]|nr:site-specific DNA-methyltransferase [Nitrospirota bacterium]
MIHTSHSIILKSSEAMSEITAESVDVVVTSPPYPMIEMWDELFAGRDDQIASALRDNDGNLAFRLMHEQMYPVWGELYRVLKNGGIACINIGDATRTVDGVFRLYPNHSYILNYCLDLGFSNLTNIIWRKQTNAPNKFMGSGMLPAGAYVTLEHEYILIFRKGTKREFKTASEKFNRQQSAFFWEERNVWHSDVWDVKGTPQNMLDKSCRNRSGAFPFEIAYRLINMFSTKGDMVLDPFLGVGTTILASMASCRSSIGYEINPGLYKTISSVVNENAIDSLNEYLRNRLIKHISFVKERLLKEGKNALKHTNSNYGFPVVTSQETKLFINYLASIQKRSDLEFEVSYLTDAALDHRPSLFMSLMGSEK